MKPASLIMLLCLIAVPVAAERYRVVEDGFGNIQAQSVDPTEGKQVPVEQAPPVEIDLRERSKSENSVAKDLEPLKPAEDVEPRKSDISKTLSPAGQIEDDLAKDSDTPDSAEEVVQPSSDLPQVAGTVEQDDAQVDVQTTVNGSLDPFEKAYLESVRDSQRAAIESLLNSPKQEYDATDISQGDYVDGDALELSGGVRDEGSAPYYIYVDSDGQQRVAYYDPEVSKAALREHSKQIKKQTSDASIYLNEALDEGKGKINFLDDAEPEAIQILFSGKPGVSEIERIKASCCKGLPDVRVRNLGKNRANYYELTKDDITFKFTAGNSKFLRLALPPAQASYPLLVRTFVRDYKTDGVENGAFMPQIITLDKNLQPVRLITDILFTFQPETWTKFGYFEAVIDIDPALEESYVVLNTTSDMLKNTTTVETEEAFVKIKHMKTGSFEVSAFVSQGLYQ